MDEIYAFYCTECYTIKLAFEQDLLYLYIQNIFLYLCVTEHGNLLKEFGT